MALQGCDLPSGRPMPSASPVVGDFNVWDGRRHPMRKRVEAGVWELFIPRLPTGTLYKYAIARSARTAAAQGRSGGAAGRAAAAHRLGGPRSDAVSLERWGVAAARAANNRCCTRRCRSMKFTPGHGAGSPTEGGRPLNWDELGDQLLAPRQRTGLHPHRAAAGHGAPVQRLLGLPGTQPVCPAGHVRRAPPFCTFRRSLPCRPASG